MLNIITWFWGSKYSVDYVQKLAAGLRRNITQEYTFSVFTDKGFFDAKYVDAMYYISEEDKLLCNKACFVRLRMFDPEWQEQYHFTDRIVSIDLDSVITGPLDELFDRPEPFVILQGANMHNPCPYNGALSMLRVGQFPEVWNEFSLEAVSKIPKHEFADDQGYIWVKLPAASGWSVGPKSGVYVYHKRAWPEGNNLPLDARIVTFIGKKNPKDLQDLPWVKEHWRI